MAALTPKRPMAWRRCQCYYKSNYYIAEYDIHLEYQDNEQEFLQENGELMRKVGCDTEEKKILILRQLNQEYLRRKNVDTQTTKRRKKIISCYVPLHEEVYILRENYLDDKFLSIVRHAKEPGATLSTLLRKVKEEKVERVFRLPVFTANFCKMLLEEFEHFEESDMPKGRPNTMNNGGILLGEVGFDETFISPFRKNYLCPLAKILFPECGGGCLDSHKAFTVKYKEEEDLGFHYDNAEVTLNVSLGKDFEDGSLYFGSMRQEDNRQNKAVEVRHKTGEGILHRGQHKHGAMPISYGERINMIIWMRSSLIRNKLCPMCDNEPELLPSIGFGDGFTKKETTVELCNLY